jgi:uncharacterized protein DUF4136
MAAYPFHIGVVCLECRKLTLSRMQYLRETPMIIQLTSLINRRLAAFASIAMLLSACTTLQVGSDYDRAATFQNYKTFTLMQRPHSGVRNPLIAARASDDIKTELQRKGFVEATEPAKADFTVDFTIGAQERTDINTYPDPYVGPAWGWGSMGWWGGPYWGTALDVRQYREGTLSIDVFDAHSHRPTWHGWAKKELTPQDLENSAEPIREAVAAVLARFPPG